MIIFKFFYEYSWLKIKIEDINSINRWVLKLNFSICEYKFYL